MTVTPEMIHAGNDACANNFDSELVAIYEAMKAVDPECVNARMIIAELYEALEMMVAEKRDYMLINKLGNPAKQHTIKVAMAALAKARGEA